MFLLRFVFCLVLAAGNGLVIVSDIWRLNSPESCNAAQLCVTFLAKTPTEVSVQIWIALVLMLFGIFLMSKTKSGRIGLGTWMAVALIPSMTLDLGYHLLMAMNITGIVQLGDRTDLNFNILVDVIALCFGISLAVLGKFAKREMAERQKHAPRTVRAESERADRKQIDP